MRTTLYRYILIIATVTVATLTGCNDSNIGGGVTSPSLNDSYTTPRMKKLNITSGYSGEQSWVITNDANETIISATGNSVIFAAKEIGTYKIYLTVNNDGEEWGTTSTIYVVEEDIAYSADVCKVYDFTPASGQFINVIPTYEDGFTAENMADEALESIQSGSLITLGGCGGYIVFGFDHTVINSKDEKDFAIYGNAYYTITDGEVVSGSCEPGIVYVSLDTNLNGVPDDEWYELAGSEYNNPETIKNYQITYVKQPDSADASEWAYWYDNQGDEGYIAQRFYTQSYYPSWIEEDELTFTLTKLPNNMYTAENGTVVQKPYDWGYVDVHPNTMSEENSFDIGWAVDSNGNSVELIGVDFIKVVSGVNDYNVLLGEESTEISGATDLNI